MIILFIAFLVAALTLVFTSYTDVRKRTINSFVFIPLVAVAALNYAYAGQGYAFIAIGILFFAGTSIRSDLYLYPVFGLAMLLTSVLLLMHSPVFLTASIMIFLIYELGFTERLFGIGDIKAMMALFFSFVQFPFIWAFTARQAFLLQILPLSFAMLINIALVSLYLPIYMIILNLRRGNGIGVTSLFGMKYDESVYAVNRKRYSIRGENDSRIMIYRSPFMVPITIGFFITVIFGFWMIYA